MLEELDWSAAHFDCDPAGVEIDHPHSPMIIEQIIATIKRIAERWSK